MGEWISVEDRLPKNGEHVLATDGMDIEIYQFLETTDKRHKKRDGRFEHSDDYYYLSDKTHWMELPALPQESQEEGE